MRIKILPAAVVALLISATFAPLRATEATSTEVKVGTSVEKTELQGAATTFKIAPGARLWVWTRVNGVGDHITVVFEKNGKQVYKQELKVPHTPYRTNAYRTFRAGDGGEWTATVLDGEGKEIAKTTFTVEVAQP